MNSGAGRRARAAAWTVNPLMNPQMGAPGGSQEKYTSRPLKR